MTVYLLKPIDEDNEEEGGWVEKITKWAEAHDLSFFTYGSCRGFVVVANSEKEAREIAACTASGKWSKPEECGWWLSPEATSCEEVDPSGEPRALMGNWPTG